MANIRLLQGNQACCYGALAAGVNFFAGYPITPSTEVVEFMAEHLPRQGDKFIQMEDEIAAMGAVCGASLAGMKALTATSGPGFSLKQEFIGYAAMTELPVTLINVQRMGPSTGNIFAAQGDVMQARWGSNGDRGVIALSPSSVSECFDITVKAVNISEKFRTPVVVLLDEIVAHMREQIILPDYDQVERVDRVKPSGDFDQYEPFKPGANGVPPMGTFGDGYMYHVTGLVHGYDGMPSNDADVATELVERLHSKIDAMREDITFYHTDYVDDAEILCISYGCSARAAKAAVKQARKRGIKVGLLTLVTIWPFPSSIIEKLTANAKKVVVAEMNRGQVAGEIEKYVERSKIISLTSLNGELFTPDDILKPIVSGLEVESHG